MEAKNPKRRLRILFYILAGIMARTALNLFGRAAHLQMDVARAGQFGLAHEPFEQLRRGNLGGVRTLIGFRFVCYRNPVCSVCCGDSDRNKCEVSRTS